LLHRLFHLGFAGSHQREPVPPTAILFKLKSGRTSATRLPQAPQTKHGSMSDGRRSSDHQSLLVAIDSAQLGNGKLAVGVDLRAFSLFA
jgi:hypothetical protein